ESILAFSNPAATSRENITIKLSYDEGKTWPISRSLYEGPSAYSCLTVLPNGHMGCLYERGKENAYETITLARFPIAWVQDNKQGARSLKTRLLFSKPSEKMVMLP